ncbi:unnamed protein product [Cylicocyclus nassatus]|uniref:DUF5641 domain-containing protein n=1 Tax=Cylicocyclus nassatus TaxID=53992 RepID=A0AA36GNG9_CYLNA|nr:unnamed protein product [Cylicocyclus nassatus]
MESIIYGKPIQNSFNTLKSLTANFATYAKEQKFLEEDANQYEETLQAIDLIRNSISQIEIAKNNLQELVDRLKHDYDNTKSKEDRKNILQQMENIEKETDFTEVSREATEMVFMLDTRLTEAISNEKRLARKLGLSHQTSSHNEVHQEHVNRMQVAARIEAIVNTRPLTSIRACKIDDIPIRPIDFLEKSLRYALPPVSREEAQDPSFDPSLIQTTTQAKQALEFVEIISEEFWERWRVEYLTALRDIQVKNRRQPRHAKLKELTVGEIVLVEQENLPRGSWCYGKVLELIKSNDELVRSVKILMPNKHVWHRPLNKIYPLEIPCPPDSPTQNIPPGQCEETTENESLETTKPIRKAKMKAKEALKSMYSEQAVNVNLFATHMLTICLYLASVGTAVALPKMACKSGKLSVVGKL